MDVLFLYPPNPPGYLLNFVVDLTKSKIYLHSVLFFCSFLVILVSSLVRFVIALVYFLAGNGDGF